MSVPAALHVAARLHHVGACIALLRGGATIGRVCSHGLSCLDVAAFQGHSFQLLQVLTAAESSADRRRRCSLALYYAAKANKIDTIRALVALGANINTKRSNGNTNLHCTAKRGADAATRALLMNGAALEVRNNDGATALHRACSSSQSSSVQLLLRWGADENATTFDNATPYELVGSAVEEEQQLSPEEVVSKAQLIRSMLVNAPADRVWRRRGWLVLCRARWLARVASRRQPRVTPVPSTAAAAAAAGSGGGGGGSSSGKAPANKKRRGKGEGARGPGGGNTAATAAAAAAMKVAHSCSGGKGKGQAAPRNKEEGGGGGGGGGSGGGSESSSSSSSSRNSSGDGHGGGGGGRGERVKEELRGVKKFVQVWGSGGGGIAWEGPGVAETWAAGGSGVAHQRPELRLGRGSVLVEGGPPLRSAAAVAAAGVFVGAVERLLLLREEGIFRDILGYL